METKSEPNGKGPGGTREFSASSTEGEGDGEVTVRYWAWVPRVEIYTTGGLTFSATGAECIAFVEALNETFRSIPRRPMRTPGTPADPAAAGDSEQAIMSRLLAAPIPDSRRSAYAASKCLPGQYRER